MTTKSLKASSGRPLPVHVSQHGRISWHTLHPKPCSRVMSDLCLCGHHAPLVLVSWCILHCCTHPYPRAPYILECSQRPTHPPTSRPAERTAVVVPLLFFFLRCGPSFLHGGLVSDDFLASGEFLKCVAGVRKDPLPLPQQKKPFFNLPL